MISGYNHLAEIQPIRGTIQWGLRPEAKALCYIFLAFAIYGLLITD